MRLLDGQPTLPAGIVELDWLGSGRGEQPRVLGRGRIVLQEDKELEVHLWMVHGGRNR